MEIHTFCPLALSTLFPCASPVLLPESVYLCSFFLAAVYVSLLVPYSLSIASVFHMFQPLCAFSYTTAVFHFTFAMWSYYFSRVFMF